MNKNTYRIIFNKIRSQWMVVPETAQSHCKSSGGAAPAESAAGAFRARISMLRFSLLLSFGLACFPAFGQIIADPTAPANQRPVVSNAANGTPVVNIQAPSAGGVSRNTYQQMDVNSGGAILNNATGNVQTQLGGWIQGNSLLGGNSARVILNEVNSSNPTYLHGFIEVAGQRAQVIVANPSGISCDGCGFINANRATLTTGTPVFTNGNLESFRVERGTVSITGAGLDASQTDYTSILARAVQVNAGIWANQLDIIAGANKLAFSADSAIDPAGITPLQTSDAAPMLAIDVAQLGGMYAGKIHLIGTETGVGVRNAGTIGASAGEVTITADGYITNSGTLRASTNLALTGENGLGNSGTAYADGSTRLSVAGEVTNIGLLASAGNVDITARTDSAGKAGTFTNADGATLAAGLSASMQIGQSGNLSVSATGNVQGSGQLAAGDTQSWSGNRVSLANEALTTHDLNVTAQSADLSGVKLATDGKVDIRAGNTLSTASASIQAGSLQLSGSTLNNVGGTLSQTGIDPFSLHFANSVDNSGGTLWTAGAADLASANFINAGGQLIAQGDVHVSATNLQNQQGALWSGRNADISAGNLDNTGGILQAVNALGISAGTLQNGKGSLLSGGAQTINVTGALDNTQGLILATDALNITATGQTITNTNGQIGSAAGNLNASFGTLDNQSGKLSAKQAIQLADGNIKNVGGSIVATGLNINTQGRAIDNTDGTIASNAGLIMNSGALDNTRGTIQALGDASIDTEGAQLTNRASGENQGILSQGQLTLKTGVLDNTGGILRSWAGATLDAGSVSNDTGNILAQTSLTLTANQYTGSGTLASYGDLSLTLQGGFTNVGHVQAAANLTLDVHGALSNQSALEAGQTLKVSATGIDNTAVGEFNAATTHLTTTGSLTNRGLIDGGLTWLEAADITNLGSGRIYGDHVAVQTGSLTNGAEGGTSAVIAARQRMDIAAGSIDNGSHAMLFSSGDMNFGGSLDASQQATGQGGTLINHSATIESLGNMALNVDHVENRNDNFQTQVVEVSRTGTQTRYEYGGRVYTPDNDGAYVDKINDRENLILRDSTGQWHQLSTEFDEYIYHTVTTETQVTQTDPAVIRAGVNLNTNSADFLNQNSQIFVGQVLNSEGGGIQNSSEQGTRTVKEVGIYRPVRNDDNDTRKEYEKKAETSFDLRTAVSVQHTSAGASGSSVDARKDTGGPDGTGKQPTITEVSGSGTQTVRTSQPSVALPDNSLFDLNLPGTPGSTSHYLIETDPRFANYQTWLSSDAMLSALGYDPATTEKRLGDGFYEQKLIREQVSLLTGQRFLQGYASDEDQYKALMDNGVSFAKKYQLVPGVALSAEQMALLTSDIVWLVEQSVKLPDGSETKVLVPQVYARAQSGDIDGSGTLIAARDVQIQLSGALANSGTIAARNSLTVNADSISQTGGRMIADSLDLTASKDISLTGGTFAGKQAVSLDAGRNVVIASQTSTNTGLNVTGTSISRTAGIEVGSEGQEAGQLIITARQDVTLTAATLVNHGTTGGTVIAAGNNLTLDTAKTSQDINFVFGNGHHIEADRSEVGTTIQTNGALQLQATAGDVNMRAATVSAGDALTIVAGNDISITAGEKSHAVDEEMHFSKKGFLSSSSSGYHNQSSESSALGSSITSKGSMTVQAERDLTVSASSLSAQGDAALSAGRDLSLQTQTYTQTSASSSYESKRGFSSDAITGVSYGSHSTQDANQNTSTRETGSSVSGANITLQAGRDATIKASDVLADQDLTLLAGRNVDILAAIETSDGTSASNSKGTSVGILGGAAPRQTLFGINNTNSNGTEQATNGVTSILSANAGNLTIAAGLDKTLTDGQPATEAGRLLTQGANIQAAQTVDLSGRSVSLEEVNSTTSSTYHTESSNLALGASLAGTFGSMITAVYDNAEAARKTDNDRLKGALALKAGYDAYKLSGSNASSAARVDDNMVGTAKGDGTNYTEADVNNGSADPSSGSAFGVSVNLSYGTSKSDSSNSSSTARGTNVQGGTVNVSATDGDLHAKGLKLQGTDVSLSATRDITLEAATNTSEVHSSNSGHNYGGGVTVGFGQQNGVSFQLSAGQNAGKANGTETTYDNTLIEASNSLKITSGRDTTLSGAQLKGKQVDANIGGNLTVTTLQDSSQYESKQSSSGLSISLCIPPICWGQTVSGNVQLTRDTINHNYQSAVGQSGIFAGDSGFNIIVSGNTLLKGGALASDNFADSHLRTASLTYEDLTNKQSTKTSSMSVSASYGSSGSLASTLANNAKTNALGNASSLLAGGNKNSNESSQTLAYIQGNVEITGTGDVAVDAKSRAAAGTLTSRDGATANGALTNSLTLADAGKLQQELQTERENARAAQLVGQVTTNAIGDLAQKEQWKEGSWQKTALHAAAGAIEAAVAKGDIGTGALAGAANEQLIGLIKDDLRDAVYGRLPANASNQQVEQANADYKALMEAASTLTGLTVGALASGGDTKTATLSANIALTATENNYLSHEDSEARAKARADWMACKDDACKKKYDLIIAALDKKDQDSDKALSDACRFPTSDGCATQVAKVQAARDSYIDPVKIARARAAGGNTGTSLLYRDVNLSDNERLDWEKANSEATQYGDKMKSPTANNVATAIGESTAGAIVNQVKAGATLILASHGDKEAIGQIANAVKTKVVSSWQLLNDDPVDFTLRNSPATGFVYGWVEDAVKQYKQADALEQTNPDAADILKYKIGTDPLANLVVGAVIGKGFGVISEAGAADSVVGDSINGSIKPLSGDLDSAGNSARTQYYGNGGSASSSPGADAAGSSGQNVRMPTSEAVNPQVVENATNGGTKIFTNVDGLSEVKITNTPLEGQTRLNTPDVGGSGKLNPAEAATAAQLEDYLGAMERAPAGASYDYLTATGKKVDIMYSTKNLTPKEVDGLNKFYEKNMTQPLGEGLLPPGQQQILDHIDKADVVPVDFRVLTPGNQKILNNFINTLTPAKKSKILIVR